MGMPPIVDLEKEFTLHKTMLELVDNRLLKSAHDCSDGGLSIALVESCFKRESSINKDTPAVLGCEVNIPLKYREDFELFGESHSRIIVSITPKDVDKFEEICNKHSQNMIKLGVVQGNVIKISATQYETNGVRHYRPETNGVHHYSINSDLNHLKKLYESVF